MIRNRCVVVITLAAILLAGCATPQPTPTSIPLPSPMPTLAPTATPTPQPAMFRNGPEHLGVYEPQAGAAEWMVEVGARLDCSPLVSGGRVYLGTSDGRFLALDVRTGKEVWDFAADAQVVSSPAIADGVLYFGSLGGTLYALDAENGKEAWKFLTGAPIVSSPAVASGLALFASFDGKIHAVDIQTGADRWTFDAATQASPAIDAGTVFFGSGDGTLYALELDTGREKWRFQAGDELISTPAVSDGIVYHGAWDGKLHALNQETGKEEWSFAQEAEIPIASSPAVADGIVYFAAVDGTVYAVDIATKGQKWQFRTGDSIFSSPAIADGTLYVGSFDGRFYALDAQTGQEKWRFQTGGEVWTSPAVAGDFVYFGSHDGRFYSLSRSGPKIALAPAPTPPPLQPTPTLMPPPTEQPAAGTGGLPWWNDRIFYEVFVRSFYDSDGDGIGDLKGLIAELDYLNDGDPRTTADLGVTGIWLMPVAESPSYHGYDVVDYKTIESDYGTNEDFKLLIAEAHKRGIVVITDLVLNHTSSEHPWFVDALNPGSEHENWYIWATERPTYTGPWGQQVWYKVGLRYYYALFWEKMPDLNYSNGAVTNTMLDVTRFWLEDMGVDGFRLDAIRHLIEDGEVQENTPATHEWINGFNRYVHAVNPQAMIVGEVWDETAEVIRYIGGKLDVAFEFDLAAAILESIWRGDNTTLVAAQANILANYPEGQYAPFLTNHDQNRVMNELRNNVESAKVAATILLTNPGVPFIYYGEEIGMRGAKPDERIRTPMQWDGSETAGFTTGTPWEELAGDVEKANVAAQDADPDSLLNHYRALIRLRGEHQALRTGDMTLVQSDSRKVYAAIRQGQKETILVVANLSEDPVSGYELSLDKGLLSGTLSAQMLLGEGKPAALIANSAGGFDAYAPLPTLQPKTSLVIVLK